MHKKYHEKFKILDILAVTTQAHEGIEIEIRNNSQDDDDVTTQAHEGIEIDEIVCQTQSVSRNNSSP